MRVEHDEIRSDIPAWAAGRLDPGARRRLEAHLEECRACASAASTALTLARAIGRDGAELFEAHPDSEDLRRHALRTGSSGDPDLERHVATCASCSLELRAWQERRTTDDQGRQRRTGWRDARIAAAGLVAGVLLGLLAVPRTREPGARAPVAPTAVPRILLQSPLRAPDGEPELTLKESATPGPTLVDVAFELPAGVDPAATVRFEIRDAAGRTVWAATEPASNVAASLARDESIGFLVPAEALAEGGHRLEVSIEHSMSPLLVVRFEVRHLRSR